MDISGIMCTVGWPRTHSIKHFSKFIRNGFSGILSTCLYRLILAKRTWTSTLWKNKSTSLAENLLFRGVGFDLKKFLDLLKDATVLEYQGGPVSGIRTR